MPESCDLPGHIADPKAQRDRFGDLGIWGGALKASSFPSVGRTTEGRDQELFHPQSCFSVADEEEREREGVEANGHCFKDDQSCCALALD
eukprot:4562546-Amphidinium_carterae.1